MTPPGEHKRRERGSLLQRAAIKAWNAPGALLGGLFGVALAPLFFFWSRDRGEAAAEFVLSGFAFAIGGLLLLLLWWFTTDGEKRV